MKDSFYLELPITRQTGIGPSTAKFGRPVSVNSLFRSVSSLYKTDSITRRAQKMTSRERNLQHLIREIPAPEFHREWIESDSSHGDGGDIPEDYEQELRAVVSRQHERSMDILRRGGDFCLVLRTFNAEFQMMKTSDQAPVMSISAAPAFRSDLRLCKLCSTFITSIMVASTFTTGRIMKTGDLNLLYLPNSNWQYYLPALIEHAKMIVLMAAALNAGITDELRMIHRKMLQTVRLWCSPTRQSGIRTTFIGEWACLSRSRSSFLI